MYDGFYYTATTIILIMFQWCDEDDDTCYCYYYCYLFKLFQNLKNKTEPLIDIILIVNIGCETEVKAHGSNS